MTNFQQAKTDNFEKLDLYVPVVARVHGGSHPEFHKVRELYDAIVAKTKQEGSETPILDSEFQQLREITSNYTVPSDVCESYEAVYKMLEIVDQAYLSDQ